MSLRNVQSLESAIRPLSNCLPSADLPKGEAIRFSPNRLIAACSLALTLLTTYYLPLTTTLWAASTPTLTLTEVLELARKNNPEILAAQKSWESAKAKIRFSKSLPAPEIGAEFMGFPRGGLNFSAAEEKRYFIGQSFPFPGQLRLRGKAAHHLAKREEATFRATELEILKKVKESYHELTYLDVSLSIFKENLELIRKFAKIAESKYAVGKVPQTDVLRAQVELSKMLNRLVTLEQERESAQAKLNALLNRNPEEPIGKTQEPKIHSLQYSFENLKNMALENRPEIEEAEHHIQHTKAELSSARAEVLPETMLQYTFRTMDGREPDSMAMIKFKLPFLWFWRQGSLLKSAKAEKGHAEAMYNSAITLSRYQVKEFLLHLQTAQRLAELYKTTVLPQAEQSLKIAEAAYQSDKIGFFELLDSERALLDFQLDYYRALADYGINLAHLERAVGKDFNE